MTASEQLSPYSTLRREVAERLISFFAGAGDGRTTSFDTGSAIATSQGPHRERNEDRCAVVRCRFGSMRPDLRLAIVCDGMGGMAKGGEAAALATGSFLAAFATVDPDCELPERLHRACQFANSAVYDAFKGEAGTTLTAIAFGVSTRWAVHVGDSRLYGLNDSRDIDLLTKDDTVSGAVHAHLGEFDEDDMDNRLLQYVGIGSALDPHLLNVSDDRDHNLWLLTSDGAHSVGRKVLSGICEGSRNPLDLVRKVVFVAEAMNTQDNATAICIKSGHVKSSDDEHEGLTIQVSGPDRNLDIWLPPSVIALTPGNKPDSARNQVIPDKPGNRLPKPAKIKKTRTTRKRTANRLEPNVDYDSVPQRVLFQIDGEGD